MCQVNTGARLKNSSNPAMENACYDFFSQIINDTNQNRGRKWVVGEAVTKAMTAGLEYAKACTSRDFNQEIRKNREEQSIKKEKLKRRESEGLSY